VPIYQVFSDDRGKAASDDEHMRSGASSYSPVSTLTLHVA